MPPRGCRGAAAGKHGEEGREGSLGNRNAKKMEQTGRKWELEAETCLQQGKARLEEKGGGKSMEKMHWRAWAGADAKGGLG